MEYEVSFLLFSFGKLAFFIYLLVLKIGEIYQNPYIW